MPTRKRSLSQNERESGRMLKQARHTRAYTRMQNQAVDMIGGLYWDLNAVCHFRQIVLDSPSQGDQQIYDEMCKQIGKFIELAVSKHLTNLVPASRCKTFVEVFGWKLFAICGHAEAFRKAYYDSNEEGWAEIIQKISKESHSIEVFARSRQLEWRGPLLVHAQHDIPALRQALGPEINIAQEHPHHIVQYLDGHLERPYYEGEPQVNINCHIYDAEKYKPFPNPLIRGQNWPECSFCRSLEHCSCYFTSMAGDLVELTESPNKGIGVRALANFKKGELLGEFVGEIFPLCEREECLDNVDNVYPLTQITYVGGELEEIALIAPAWRGNWTRFLNHSCDPSTIFLMYSIGNHVTTLIVARRDIPIFEEITVDYGKGYWKGRGPCLCGTSSCHYSSKTKK